MKKKLPGTVFVVTRHGENEMNLTFYTLFVCIKMFSSSICIIFIKSNFQLNSKKGFV